MESAGPRTTSGFSSSLKWSLIAGVYMLVCAAVLVVLMGQVTVMVADLLALPSVSALWLAGPVPGIGAVVWWLGIEQRNGYTYLLGSVIGLVTAFLTVLFWVLRGAMVWGVEGVLAGWPLIVAVLAPTVPVGLIVGVPMMYARRRLDDGRSAARH